MNPRLSWILPFLIYYFLPVQGGDVDFSAQIRPLLAEKCLECHGPDKQKGDLRLDDSESTHRALSGDELLVRITTDDPEMRMPPKGPRLGEKEVATLRQWIAEGARFEPHWAYAPLNQDPPPTVKHEEWVQNPIDRYILARLEKEGIAPSPAANRSTLIKRLYYDLTGLPPSPEEVDAFVNNPSSQAYSELVDKLLASPHYGERWARHWLDKARYADSDGYEKDNPRPQAWHYRDWVIRALNEDMPMDQFTLEQLAGDLLPGATSDQKIATAFHRQTLTNTEGGTDKEEFRTEAVFDRTETTGTIWLGLTMNCARCHNHKYDSILQAEYYQLFDFFNNGDETNFNLPVPEEAMVTYRAAKEKHEAKEKALALRIEKAQNEVEGSFKAWLADRSASAEGAASAFHDLQKTAAIASDTDVALSVAAQGIVQVGGANPEGPLHYLVTATTSTLTQPVTGLRIDALSDSSLPAMGPGRVAHGNFVLTEVEASLDGKSLEWAGAMADFSQDGWEASQLVDGKQDVKNGWAVAPQMGRDHYAILKLKTPLVLSEGQNLSVKLIQNYGQQHALGKFRIRLMTGHHQGDQPEAIENLLSKPQKKLDEKEMAKLRDHFFGTVHVAGRKLDEERDKLKKSAPKEPVTAFGIITQRPSPRETHLLERGNFLSPAERVSAAGPSVLPQVQGRNPERLDRLDLARWLMSPENPLPPRVLANQMWEKLFGHGLVRTLNDFGVRGEVPEYPELLDWLGTEYRRLGWSRKALIRTLVHSATYQQASVHREELAELDPENRFYGRQNRFRVEAEITRDLCLSIAGLLSPKIGGPSVFPPMPPEIAALSYANNFKWVNSQGENRYRRGMYTFFKRTSPHPNLITFDCPDSNTTNVKRSTSNTPLQALTMLNNEVYIEAARAFADRILKCEAEDDRQRIHHALRLCIARHPGATEVDRFSHLLKESREWFEKNPQASQELTGKSEPDPRLAAWVAVARIALNLDELMTRE